MLTVFLHLTHQLRAASRRSAEYSERHFFALGLICSIILPLTTLIERMVVDPFYDTLLIRIIAATFSLPLLFYKRLTGFPRRVFDIYWVVGVAYLLPFSFGLMLVLNAGHTPITETVSSIWIYQYIVALFFFIQLIHHGGLSILLWLAATFVTFLSLLLVSDLNNWEQIKVAALFPLPIYITTIFVGSITNRNIYVVQTEKIKAVSAIGSNIAHELRTPLASIRSISHGIGNYLGALIDGYEQARAANLPVYPIRGKHLKTLQSALSSIENEVVYSNTIIDMLLINTGGKLLSGLESETILASDCVKEAVERYPFNNSNENELIRTEVQQDFLIQAPRLLIIHTLFNLLKNSLYYVQQSGKGDILIELQIENNSTAIKVHDTGPGIPRSRQKEIFNRFYTTTDEGLGTGIGLSFCKMVMESLGGSITCDSVEGEYTTFILTFPKVASHLANSR